MFKKILIANRGEIAIRIMRACRELGIQTVAVYSTADRNAPHTSYADEIVHIGDSASSESYLKIDKIIQAALDTNSEAIHPGYGFLSEKSEFADAVNKAGLKFIGPSASAIAAMGSKTAARKRMKSVGVPVAPGVEEPISSYNDAIEIARSIGFPLLIKAAHGGGGKGMRKVFDESELESALQSAMRESLTAFHSNEVYIEKFIVNPHHIEVQILADSFGNIIHLWERECSIQRRHQKLIEESPSPFLRDDVRRAICNTAVLAAKAVSYENAGTIEFLVDENQNYYFLEMNTRLQVEHPITELVTGIDIVHQQLKIASGEPLEIQQKDVKQIGWAIECRICAEDPLNSFLPSTGVIQHLRAPSGPGIRDDRGINQHDQVSIFYDSLLAKLICYGENRFMAIERMKRALEEYQIAGISTTIPFFHKVMSDEIFLSGVYNTGFIDKFYIENELAFKKGEDIEWVALAAVLYQKLQNQSQSPDISDATTTFSKSSWKLLGRLEQFRK